MPPITRPGRTSGAPPGVGSAWPSRITGTVFQNAEPLAATSASSVVERLNAAAATALAFDVSGVKNPVPSPRAHSTSRPPSSTTVTVIGEPISLARACSARTACSASSSVISTMDALLLRVGSAGDLAVAVQNLRFEVRQRLPEDRVEILEPTTAVGEAPEVHDQPVEAMSPSQVVRHQERELIGRQRAVTLMPRGEASRTTEGCEVQPALLQRRIVTNLAEGDGAPLGQSGESEGPEDREGRPSRHALGQPLLGLAFALGQLDLRHVRQLVRDEPQPVARSGARALAVASEPP